MMPTMFKLKVKLLLSILLVALTGCNRPVRREMVSKTKLRWVTLSEPSTLNWNQCYEPRCLTHVSLLMEGLFRTSMVDSQLQLEPVLAERWSTSSPKVIEIFLKPAQWSDGTRLLPRHWRMAWERLLKDCRANDYVAQRFANIRNGRQFCHGNARADQLGIRFLSENRVQFELEKADPAFLVLLSHPRTWPIFSERPTEPGSISLGPFVLSRWVRGREMVYEPNPYHRPVNSDIASITVEVRPSPVEAAELFSSGEVHLIDSVPASFPSQTLAPLLPMTQGAADTWVLERDGQSPNTLTAQALSRELLSSVDQNEIARIARIRLCPLPNSLLNWGCERDKIGIKSSGIASLLSDFTFPRADGPTAPSGDVIIVLSGTDEAPELSVKSEIRRAVEVQWQKLGFRVESTVPSPTGPNTMVLKFHLALIRRSLFNLEQVYERISTMSSIPSGALRESPFLEARDFFSYLEKYQDAENRLWSRTHDARPMISTADVAFIQPKLAGISSFPGGGLNLASVHIRE